MSVVSPVVTKMELDKGRSYACGRYRGIQSREEGNLGVLTSANAVPLGQRKQS